MIKDVHVVFGKGHGSQQVPNDENGHVPMWKKKSILWELPYWEESLREPPRFPRYVWEGKRYNQTRRDLKEMKQQEDLRPEKRDNGQHYLHRASYTLSKEKKESMFDCLNSMKIPSGYTLNIQGRINRKEKKFTNLMSHDYHILMTQLLPVALRGILPENIRLAIMKLCAFLNKILQTATDPNKIIKLQNNVVQYLVNFEMVFPPSFFNIMTNLLVHIVKEINILDPVFLHNMFPFERYMAVLKKYVRNHSHPEGCIAKGYGIEEVIEFCVDFIDDLRPIGVLMSHHERRPKGKGTLAKKSNMHIPDNEIHKANFTVLQNSSLVVPYMEEHMNIVRSKNPGKSDTWITGHHIDTFAIWLRQKFMADGTIDEQL
jgi:hypothetical protein